MVVEQFRSVQGFEVCDQPICQRFAIVCISDLRRVLCPVRIQETKSIFILTCQLCDLNLEI